MFVGVQKLILPLVVSHEFQGAIGDHLVGVHVGRGASAALDDIDDELRMEMSGLDFLAGRNDGAGVLLAQTTERSVGQCGGMLYFGKGGDEFRI